MAADPPPLPDAPPVRPSLFEQVGWALRRAVAKRSIPPGEGPTTAQGAATDRTGLVVALLLVGAPVFTWAGAALMARSAWNDAGRLDEQAAPVLRARRDADAARRILSDAWQRPGVGSVVERLAVALPPDTSILRLERDRRGELALEVATPDPDPVAAALRRDPALTNLRTVEQTRGDGAMRVVLRSGS